MKVQRGDVVLVAFDSAVTCETLATVERSLIQRKIGELPSMTMSAIDACLKAALAIA
jgi:mRNA-degrading endonuclease toxin of MazEF toxin-antitoxin module